MAKIYPAELSRMMGLPLRSKKTIQEEPEKNIKHPVVKHKRKKTEGLLRPK